MVASTPPSYRSNRPLYYTDKAADSANIGSIITTFKAIDDVYDNSYVPFTPYVKQSGDANTDVNPEYQFPGYIYCDGAEYNISDFPALYQAIGNEYGGEPKQAITITAGGSGYDTNDTIVFDSPPGYDAANPGALQIIEANLTVVNGAVTAIVVTKLGFGYDPTNPPGFTINGVGSGTGLTLEYNFSASGALQAISPANIFDYWGDSNLGTFKVPDLKTRKIVGYGNVYGPGTPTTGLLTLGVGNDYKGGSWLLTKAAQGGYFSLGTITTTGYEQVVDSASTSIIGSQTVLIEMNDKRLQSVPQHTHFVYHSSASQDLAHPAGYSGDRYLVQYNNGQKSLYSFFPVGGLAFEHKHALLKQPLSDNTVATYDLFDYVPGASGTGSTKWGYENDQYYMASGSQGAGTYELITYVPVTVFKKFNNSSKIGGRTEFAGATPIIEYSSLNSYTVAGNYTLAMPAAWETMQILAAGGGGGGCSGDNQGGDGGDSIVQVGDGSGLTITAPGGGGASLINGGVVTNALVEGTDAGNFGTVVDKGAVGGSGSAAGPFLIKDYPDNPSTGGAGGSVLAGNDGGDGVNGYVNIAPYTIDDTLTNNSGSIDIESQYLITNITITLAGAQGVSKGNANGGNGTNGGSGGQGSKLVLTVKNPSSGFTANYTNGQQGSGKSGGGGFGTGGSGGNKNGSGQNGGGGGGCTAINIGGETIAGAGGGGGGGGYDGGNSDNGFAGGSNNTPGWNSNSPLSTSSNLFSGGGANGGNAGCNGGGGGGGGAGCASSSYTGTGGGKGGGGGGPAGHGGGKGGGRGMTSYKSNLFDLVSQNSNNSGDGYTAYSFTIDQSYWTQGGGGGASGNYMYGTIDSDDMTTNSGNISITVGAGGNGGGGGESGNSGQVQVNFGEIVGYEGGVSSVTVGDIIIAGDEDVEIYGNGGGTGSSGGFKLPTTQVPEVEILGGGGGTGAAGTVTVTGGVVNSISLTSGGSNYTAVPEVRIKHGAGTNAYATAEVDQVSKTVTALNLSTLITPATYTHYVKFRGDTQERFIVIKEHDCTNVNRFVIKVARGNGQNGGNTPEHGGDELKIYWNSDQSLNFSNFLGVIVPLAANDPDYTGVNYDGTGSGTNPTNWYWYEVILPNNAKTGATRFKIAQERNPGASTNDNAGDTDHFGICDFIYEYDEVTELVFVPADGSIPKSADQLSYTVEGKENATYPTGATGLDATFTLNSQNPLLPTAAIDPDYPIPLVESYHLCKYLIKAF